MSPYLRSCCRVPHVCVLVTSLLIACVSGGSQPPRLSPTKVIRIADAKAQSALHRDLREFHRLAPRYSAERGTWSVVYNNTKDTAPSSVEVQLFDRTGKAQATFGDVFK
jgi:hypothetical protein